MRPDATSARATPGSRHAKKPIRTTAASLGLDRRSSGASTIRPYVDAALFASAPLAESPLSLHRRQVTRRFWPGLAVPALMCIGAVVPVPASAISIDCSARPSSPLGYEIAAVHADQIAVPQSTPPVAILDTGVAQVPELAGRLRPGSNVTTGSASTGDIDGHGTAVASVVAAAAGGVRGVAPTTPIIPIKIFDDLGNTTPQAFAAGISRAVDAGAA